MWDEVCIPKPAHLVLTTVFLSLPKFGGETIKGSYQLDNTLQIMNTRYVILEFSY